MAKGAVLAIGIGIISLLAIFLVVELFSGPINPLQGNQQASGPANPGGYGSTGKDIAKTAAQATNVANAVAGDLPQVAGDIATAVQSAQYVASLFKHQDGGGQGS